MATAKKSATTEKKENKTTMSSAQDLTQILEMMADMKNKFNTILEENKALKEKIENIGNLESKIEDAVDLEETIHVMPEVNNTPLSKIKIYHMQELVGGTVTYIKLTNTTRTLQHMGQVMTLNLNGFQI